MGLGFAVALGASKIFRRFHWNRPARFPRVGQDASRITDEYLPPWGLLGSMVKIPWEVEAEIACGTSANVVRTVTENAGTLSFTSQGFETD